MEAVRGHIQGMSSPRSDAANVYPSPPSSDAATSTHHRSSAVSQEPVVACRWIPSLLHRCCHCPPTTPTSTHRRSSVLCQEQLVSRPLISSLLHWRRLGSIHLELPFLLVSLTPTLTPKLAQTPLRTISTATSFRSPGAMLCASSCAWTTHTGALYAPNFMHQWCKLNEVKDHVLGMVKSVPLRQNYKKKCSPTASCPGMRDRWSRWSDRVAPMEDLCCYVICDVN
jgi:hypothetical protein